MWMRGATGALVLLFAGGATVDWLAPSLKPSLSAAVGRDVATMLESRSPGVRLAGALLTKIKRVLASDAGKKPSLGSSGSPDVDRTTRRRMIPARSHSSDSPPLPVNEDLQQLLGPLAGLESGPLVPVVSTAGTTGSGSIPLALIGVGGAGGGGNGGSPGADLGAAPPAVSIPVAPVPEPATWLTLLIGFGMAGAQLRSGGRQLKAAVRR